MKKYFVVLIFTIFIQVGSGQNVFEPSANNTLSYSLNDTTEYLITFYKKGKIQSVEKYAIVNSQRVKNGYQYEFYANQRLKKITHYNFDSATSFLAFYREDGKTIDVIDFDYRTGKEFLNMDADRFLGVSGATHITSAHGSNDSNFLQLHLNYTLMDVFALVEVSVVDPKFRTGLYLYRNEKYTYFIKNYYRNKKYGEGFIFNSRGKLKMLSFTNFGNPESAYKVKSIKL